MPAAIALIVGAGDFRLLVQQDVSFGGIALGTVAVLVAYHLMAWLEAMVAARRALSLLGTRQSRPEQRGAPTPSVVSPD